MAASVHLRLRKLPTGLATYPRVVFNRRPAITEVSDPPVFTANVGGVALSRASVAKYAKVCGYGDCIPPTYLHVLAMPLHLEIFACASFPLRPMGLIHLSNVIEIRSALRYGMRLDFSVSARNYRRTDAGLAFDMATEISHEGRPVWLETCVFLSRWPESAERGGVRPPRPPKAPKDAAVLAELDVTSRTAWDYARVSTDYNPIHLSDRIARYLGLRGAISHGMWSLARSLAQPPVPALAAGTTIETQFLTPVQLPARVAIKEWMAEGQQQRALCDVRTGRLHMYSSWSVVPPAQHAA
ncbi:MAG TPA: MaoC/PaaZ C-terminal domain-containing protein [Steroidobacteraceae bacterium]|nr:MaoC/PaaZ C-terminal domain-containing protein [Steroidobacteraceae bacterium]